MLRDMFDECLRDFPPIFGVRRGFDTLRTVGLVGWMGGCSDVCPNCVILLGFGNSRSFAQVPRRVSLGELRGARCTRCRLHLVVCTLFVACRSSSSAGVPTGLATVALCVAIVLVDGVCVCCACGCVRPFVLGCRCNCCLCLCLLLSVLFFVCGCCVCGWCAVPLLTLPHDSDLNCKRQRLPGRSQRRPDAASILKHSCYIFVGSTVAVTFFVVWCTIPTQRLQRSL